MFSGMDTAASSSFPRPAEVSSADRVSVASRIDGGSTPKRRERRQLLTKVDGRLPLGKRVKRLVELFSAEFPSDALTPLRRDQIYAAAQLQALAEAERGAWMRGEARCDLDELVRLERRAVAAVKALGIEERQASKSAPSLAGYLASKASGNAT
jgi:hypothetical protein